MLTASWKSGGMAMYTNTHNFKMYIDVYRGGDLITVEPGDVSPKVERQVDYLNKRRKKVAKVSRQSLSDMISNWQAPVLLLPERKALF